MKYKIEYNHEYKDFEDVWNIEKNYLNPITISSIEQVLEWENKNHDVHIFIKDIIKKEIVGEITILPLSKNQFDKFMNNQLEDTEINANTLLKYERNKSYYLLFSTIAIAPNYRNEKIILSLLLEGLNNKLKMLSSNGIKFLNMCAEGQTSDGQKFIESFLNLKFKKYTKEGYKLYCFDNQKEFDNWIKKLPEYIERYNNNNLK